MGKDAFVSNPYIAGYSADKVVDGNLTTYGVSTNNYTTGTYYWWKVDIGERIIFNYATIYVRDGKCENPPIDCCK